LAAEIGRALVHLSYVVAVTILGFVFITAMWPFVSFLIDSGVRNSIRASGPAAVVSIFVIGWGTLSQRLDLVTVLVGSFVVGEIGFAVSFALFIWPSGLQKTVRKFLPKSLAELNPMPETTESEAEFRLWLLRYPEKKAYYDWEHFLVWIDCGLFFILLVFSLIYLVYSVCIAWLLRSAGFGSHLWILGFSIVVLSILLTVLVGYDAKGRAEVVTSLVKVLYKQFLKDTPSAPPAKS
jgi:hypothetical protein